jgi:hypothetical protein
LYRRAFLKDRDLKDNITGDMIKKFLPADGHAANETLRVSPSYSVRPNGAVHQWRKDPPRELSVDPGSGRAA